MVLMMYVVWLIVIVVCSPSLTALEKIPGVIYILYIYIYYNHTNSCCIYLYIFYFYLFIYLFIYYYYYYYHYYYYINTVIIDGPDSVNAIEGNRVQFSCIVVAKEIDFFINNSATNDPHIVQAGFIESGVDVLNINATKRRLNLTATALFEYNTTTVYCRGLNTVGDLTVPAYSEVATLFIQGEFIMIV